MNESYRFGTVLKWPLDVIQWAMNADFLEASLPVFASVVTYATASNLSQGWRWTAAYLAGGVANLANPYPFVRYGNGMSYSKGPVFGGENYNYAGNLGGAGPLGSDPLAPRNDGQRILPVPRYPLAGAGHYPLHQQGLNVLSGHFK